MPLHEAVGVVSPERQGGWFLVKRVSSPTTPLTHCEPSPRLARPSPARGRGAVVQIAAPRPSVGRGRWTGARADGVAAGSEGVSDPWGPRQRTVLARHGIDARGDDHQNTPAGSRRSSVLKLMESAAACARLLLSRSWCGAAHLPGPSISAPARPARRAESRCLPPLIGEPVHGARGWRPHQSPGHDTFRGVDGSRTDARTWCRVRGGAKPQPAWKQSDAHRGATDWSMARSRRIGARRPPTAHLPAGSRT